MKKQKTGLYFSIERVKKQRERWNETLKKSQHSTIERVREEERSSEEQEGQTEMDTERESTKQAGANTIFRESEEEGEIEEEVPDDQMPFTRESDMPAILLEDLNRESEEEGEIEEDTGAVPASSDDHETHFNRKGTLETDSTVEMETRADKMNLALPQDKRRQTQERAQSADIKVKKVKKGWPFSKAKRGETSHELASPDAMIINAQSAHNRMQPELPDNGRPEEVIKSQSGGNVTNDRLTLQPLPPQDDVRWVEERTQGAVQPEDDRRWPEEKAQSSYAGMSLEDDARRSQLHELHEERMQSALQPVLPEDDRRWPEERAQTSSYARNDNRRSQLHEERTMQPEDGGWPEGRAQGSIVRMQPVSVVGSQFHEGRTMQLEDDGRWPEEFDARTQPVSLEGSQFHAMQPEHAEERNVRMQPVSHQDDQRWSQFHAEGTQSLMQPEDEGRWPVEPRAPQFHGERTQSAVPLVEHDWRWSEETAQSSNIRIQPVSPEDNRRCYYDEQRMQRGNDGGRGSCTARRHE